jgi:hypothetical protein
MWPAGRKRALTAAVPAGVKGAWEGNQARPDQIQESPHQGGVTGEADAQGVLQHQRQQPGGGFGAVDGATEAGGDEVGQAAHVVQVAVGDEQGLDAVGVELDALAIEPGAVRSPLGALEQAAVDEEPPVPAQVQLVAGAGDAVHGAVVSDGKVHGHRP